MRPNQTPKTQADNDKKVRPVSFVNPNATERRYVHIGAREAKSCANDKGRASRAMFRNVILKLNKAAVSMTIGHSGLIEGRGQTSLELHFFQSVNA